MKKLLLLLIFCIGCTTETNVVYQCKPKIVREKYRQSQYRLNIIVADDDSYCTPSDKEFLKIRVGKEYDGVWFKDK